MIQSGSVLSPTSRFSSAIVLKSGYASRAPAVSGRAPVATRGAPRSRGRAILNPSPPPLPSRPARLRRAEASCVLPAQARLAALGRAHPLRPHDGRQPAAVPGAVRGDEIPPTLAAPPDAGGGVAKRNRAVVAPPPLARPPPPLLRVLGAARPRGNGGVRTKTAPSTATGCDIPRTTALRAAPAHVHRGLNRGSISNSFRSAERISCSTRSSP
jgi:hypothetical protein